MKRGFTLIELLAVIVILAIIALIAVPVVVNIINDSKESSLKRSVDLYINSVKTSVTKESMNPNLPKGEITCTILNEQSQGTGYDKDDLICIEDNNENVSSYVKIDIKGETPINGEIKLNNGKIIEDKTWLEMSNNIFYKYDNNILVKINMDEVRHLKSRLPSEYQEVEYIEAPGGQYIDTGLKADVFPIRIKYSAAKSNLEQPSRLYGNLFPYVAAQKYGNYTRFYSYIEDKGIDKKLSFTFQPNGSNSLYNGIKDVDIDFIDTDFVVIDNEVTETYTKLLINDKEYYMEYEKSNYIGEENITIFRLVDHIHFYSNGKLKYFKVYIENALKINLIPCYSIQDGKVGMYDLVEGKFYTNQGSGEFIKGPDVN